uniref:SCP domain-containing protein n=1 Tax=Corethron hystrix TaxID=216773 RepID=A0A7S1BZD7_9STRA|mmetsp:Transcript_5627/g.11756  ORF Transcript_5627/g.11756 Transcript_5627/m.11756 type:complete len:263 (+) Transcript_5627:131-919(+)
MMVQPFAKNDQMNDTNLQKPLLQTSIEDGFESYEKLGNHEGKKKYGFWPYMGAMLVLGVIMWVDIAPAAENNSLNILNVAKNTDEMAEELLEYTNVRRESRGIKRLIDSEKGSQMATVMARDLADSGKEGTSSDSCHASYASLGHTGSSVKEVFDDWWESEQDILLNEGYGYSGVGVVTRESDKVVYAVQLLCSYNFVDNLTVPGNEDKENAIRTNILSGENQIRANYNVKALDTDPAFEDLVQKTAIEAAQKNEVQLPKKF